MTHEEFMAEGARRFGPDMSQWKFVCPVCGHVASVQQWREAGATEGQIAFSCIGRYIEGSKEAFATKFKAKDKNLTGPCNYAGGGLFRLNPMEVEGERYFSFAPAEN